MIKKKQGDQSDGGGGSFPGIIDELVKDHKEKLRRLEAEYRQQINEARKMATSATPRKHASASRGQEELLREKVAFLELQEKEMRKEIESLKRQGGAATRQDVETRYFQGIENDTREGGIIDLVDDNLDEHDLETSRFKNNTVDSEAESELAFLKQETKYQKQLILHLSRELESLKSSHEGYVKMAEEIKEKACQEAHEELIRRVEVQFQQANDVYVKLKKKYQESQVKIEKLEGDLEMAITGLDLALKEKERFESGLRAQLERNASLEQKMLRMEEKHAKEMKQIMKVAKDLKVQYINVENSSRLARKTIEYTIAERDLLQEKLDAALSKSNGVKRQVDDETSQMSQLDFVLEERENLQVELQAVVIERDDLKHLCGELMTKLKDLEDRK